MRETLASFRWSMVPWLFIAAAAVPPGLGIAWLFAKRPLTGFDLLAATCGGYAGGLVLTLLITSWWKVHVGTWGLRCFDAYGLFHEVEWSEIVGVRLLFFPGLSTLRILRGGNRRALWLPLWLADMRRFEELVSRHAGPTNPLTRALIEGDFSSGLSESQPCSEKK
jgi:hypothetical protein